MAKTSDNSDDVLYPPMAKPTAGPGTDEFMIGGITIVGGLLAAIQGDTLFQIIQTGDNISTIQE